VVESNPVTTVAVACTADAEPEHAMVT